MKKIIIIILSIFSFSAFAQGILMNNDPFIILNNSAYVVINTGSATGITQLGTGGRIVSESETNIIRWNISNSTGTYTLPYYDIDNASEIPFSVTIGTAGSAGGRIDFSTYDNTGASSWDNSLYMPSDVTNMNSAIGGPNNSAMVIDRFWITDANTYTTKPDATFSFTYIDAEWSAAGNTITEGNLGAQRFNTPALNWDAYVPQGTVSTAANTVTGVPVPAAEFFRSWTLSDNLSPLPIELIYFNGNCENNKAVLKWTTASETNNDYFTIERSTDLINFTEIGKLAGAGNSSSTLNYSFIDNNSLSSGAYYRIRQTDFNGDNKTSSAIHVTSCGNSGSIDIFNGGNNSFILAINTPEAGDYTMTVYNELGQHITEKTIFIEQGFSKTTIQLENIATALYFINVKGKDNSVTKKISILK